MQSSVLCGGQDLQHLGAGLVLPATGVVRAELHQYWLPEGAMLFSGSMSKVVQDMYLPIAAAIEGVGPIEIWLMADPSCIPLPAVEMRSKVAKEMAIKEKAQKEKALRELADQARRERAGGAAVPVAARDSGAPALAALNGGGNLRIEDELPPPPGMGQVSRGCRRGWQSHSAECDYQQLPQHPPNVVALAVAAAHDPSGAQ